MKKIIGLLLFAVVISGCGNNGSTEVSFQGPGMMNIAGSMPPGKHNFVFNRQNAPVQVKIEEIRVSVNGRVVVLKENDFSDLRRVIDEEAARAK